MDMALAELLMEDVLSRGPSGGPRPDVVDPTGRALSSSPAGTRDGAAAADRAGSL